MDILLFNTSWMIFNGLLAVLPVLFLWLLFRVHNKFLKVILGILWFIYLPNTLYLLTDLIHIPEQWQRVEESEKIVLIFQYICLLLVGFVTFLLSVSPIEYCLFHSKRWKKEKKLDYAILITINLLVGFGVVLGRTERVNSWELFTKPGQVIDAVLTVFSSLELFLLAVLIGLFANFFYFLFRKPFFTFGQMRKKN